jgi:ribosome-binding factor A
LLPAECSSAFDLDGRGRPSLHQQNRRASRKQARKGVFQQAVKARPSKQIKTDLLPGLSPDLGFLISLRVFLYSRCALEHRGQKYHRGRLSEAIREEIETILEGELGDPRIGLASVSAVLMAQDARSARIMVTVAGDEAEAERTLEGLTAAKNYVRHELAERLRLRKPPELYFQIDRADALESRVDELLNREKKRRRKSVEPSS